VAMSGVVGGALYLAAIGAATWRLYVVSRTNLDADLAALARVMVILSLVFLAAAVGFHTFIQDRAGDAYWMVTGLLIGPLAVRRQSAAEGRGGAPD